MDYSIKPLYAAVDFRLGSRHFSIGDRIPSSLPSADLRYLVRVGRAVVKPQDPPAPAAPPPQTPPRGPEIGSAWPPQDEPARVVASEPRNAPKPSAAPRPPAKKAASARARATIPRT